MLLHLFACAPCVVKPTVVFAYMAHRPIGPMSCSRQGGKMLVVDLDYMISDLLGILTVILSLYY